jgi:hypothetical protein
MDTMQAFVEALKVSRKQSHRNLAVIPLLASDHGDPDYLTLEEGLSQGLVIITEISTGGKCRGVEAGQQISRQGFSGGWGGTEGRQTEPNRQCLLPDSRSFRSHSPTFKPELESGSINFCYLHP